MINLIIHGIIITISSADRVEALNEEILDFETVGGYLNGPHWISASKLLAHYSDEPLEYFVFLMVKNMCANVSKYFPTIILPHSFFHLNSQ